MYRKIKLYYVRESETMTLTVLVAEKDAPFERARSDGLADDMKFFRRFAEYNACFRR